jgi:hypothetical protein
MLEQIVFAAIVSTSIVTCKIFIEHIIKVNDFFNKLQEMFNAYYTLYPKHHIHRFAGIVMHKHEAYMRFWVQDFNQFILEPNMLKELYEGAQKYHKQWEETSQEFREDIDLECPWCHNSDVEQFLWYDTTERKDGRLECQKCYAASPVGTYNKIVDLMSPETKRES